MWICTLQTRHQALHRPFFMGGTLPTAWLGDATDDGSLSSPDTGEKTSSISDVKIAFDGRSDSPVEAKLQDLEHAQELDPTAAGSFGLPFQPGKAYEVRGSPGFVLHHIGECSPCLYHTRKADGCRKGDDCNVSEAKKRRNRNQLEAHKAHRRAARREATRESKASDS